MENIVISVGPELIKSRTLPNPKIWDQNGLRRNVTTSQLGYGGIFVSLDRRRETLLNLELNLLESNCIGLCPKTPNGYRIFFSNYCAMLFLSKMFITKWLYSFLINYFLSCNRIKLLPRLLSKLNNFGRVRRQVFSALF